MKGTQSRKFFFDKFVFMRRPWQVTDVDPIKKGMSDDQVSLGIILGDINIFDNVEATDGSFILPSINHQASTCQNSFVNPVST